MTKTLGTLFLLTVASGIAVCSFTAFAATKTDTAATTTAKPAVISNPPKPSPPPGRPGPVFVVQKPNPTKAPPRYRAPFPLPEPGSVTMASANEPAKSYPAPAEKPSWAKEPAVRQFVKIVYVIFPKGDTRSFQTFDSTDGHRLEIYSYTVQWHLPRDQTGVIDFAPTYPDNTLHSDDSLGLYADPGKPLKIYGSRTMGEGSGTAIITFFGEETPVPFEHANPTRL